MDFKFIFFTLIFFEITKINDALGDLDVIVGLAVGYEIYLKLRKTLLLLQAEQFTKFWLKDFCSPDFCSWTIGPGDMVNWSSKIWGEFAPACEKRKEKKIC